MDPESHDSISSIESGTGVIVVEVARLRSAITQSRAEEAGKFGENTSSESSVSDIEGSEGMDCCTSFPSDVRSLVVVGFVCVALTVLDLEACSNRKANK